MTKKSEFRKIIRDQLVSLKHKKEKDHKIIQTLNSLVFGKNNVLVYVADHLEVSLDTLLSANPDTNFFFPRISENQQMQFVLPLAWETGPFNISQPVCGETILPEKADLCIIPALGYNKNGYRLGRGAGFYDKFLSNVIPANIVGLTYEELFPLSFPVDEHDIYAGTLITEKRIRQFSHKS